MGKIVPYEIFLNLSFDLKEFRENYTIVDKEMERKGFKLWSPIDTWIENNKINFKIGSYKDWKYIINDKGERV